VLTRAQRPVRSALSFGGQLADFRIARPNRDGECREVPGREELDGRERKGVGGVAEGRWQGGGSGCAGADRRARSADA
jgi:hypothetical protein